MKSHIGSRVVAEFPLPEPMPGVDSNFYRGVFFCLLFSLPIWAAIITTWWILT